MRQPAIDRFGRILIPKRLRQRLGLSPDTPVRFEVVGDALVVRPVPDEAPLRRKGGVLVAEVDGLADLGDVIDEVREARNRDIFGR